MSSNTASSEMDSREVILLSSINRLKDILGVAATENCHNNHHHQQQQEESCSMDGKNSYVGQDAIVGDEGPCCPVLIRTPLARKLVFQDELMAELWAAVRSFVMNSTVNPMLGNFWASLVIDQPDSRFANLKSECTSSNGVTVAQVAEHAKDFVKEQLLQKDVLSSMLSKYTTFVGKTDAESSCHYSTKSTVYATRNGRSYMEDHYIMIENIVHTASGKGFSLYIVFDGHNGSETALFAAKHIPYFLLTHPTLDICAAIQRVQFLIEERNKEQKIAGGSTLVLALFVDGVIRIAWLGDSQVYAVNSGVVTFKTSPHKPNRRDEYERIQRQGGCVVNSNVCRINGISAVSRSLGDIPLKPYIIHEPEIHVTGRSDVIVLATDGFSEHCTDQELLNSLYSSQASSADSVCRDLVNIAQDNQSCDNITVMVIVPVATKWPLNAGLGNPSPAAQMRYQYQSHSGTSKRSRLAANKCGMDEEFISNDCFRRPLSALVTSSPSGAGAVNWRPRISDPICMSSPRRYSDLM